MSLTKIDFVCPGQDKTAFDNVEDFQDHLIKCRKIQNKKVFPCNYHIGHLFDSLEEKLEHEDYSCKVKFLDFRPNYRNNLKYFYLGKKEQEKNY